MSENLQRRQGVLYAAMLIAAFAVIVFSVLGIATMTGWLPSAKSEHKATTATADSRKLADAEAGKKAEREAERAQTSPSKAASPRGAQGTVRNAPATPGAKAPVACADCGVVLAVRAFEREGEGTMLGAGAGAVIGGLLGNQVGGGSGRAVATVAGAGAGAFAGNEIERNMNKRTVYEVRVRMNDGTQRSFQQSAPPSVRPGDKIRITDGRIVPE